ncbi:MAG TPA: alpha/beta hydrolase [Longimicrobium sp.]|nr:alpha/beta hydrolase [Longimicrobium sp.]
MSATRERTGELRAQDGVRLHYRSWPAPVERAVLLVSHGLGEHGGRYAALAEDLAEHGITVHAIDHRGHGLSGGRRGHVAHFGEFVRDFETFRAAIAKEHPSAPLFLLGHSLGGLIAIHHLQTHPEAGYRGAVLSAPLVGIAVQAPRWKVALSGFLSRLIPWLPFHNEIETAMLSTAPGYEAAYRADTLLHNTITPRLYTEMVRAIDGAFQRPDGIQVPLLVLAPTADRVVLPEAVARFASACPGDVETKRYVGFQHESLNEKDRHQVVADVAAWLKGRVPGTEYRVPSTE